MPRYVDEAVRTRDAITASTEILAAVSFDGAAQVPGAGPGLTLRIPNERLATSPAQEVWPAMGAVVPVAIDGARAAADDRSLFAAIETETRPGEALDAVASALYLRLLNGVTLAGFPHLLRVWNYVPRIHDDASGIERYMSFCKGRADALAAHFGEAFAEQLPAASAVGCPGDTLIVHLLASREPGRHVENPRQVSAYRYPERYGPKSPSFARGTVAPAAWAGAVFVSGTASIVGHESVFPGDPVRQVEETMRNVEAVLDAAGVPGRGGALGGRLRSLRVYVRHPEQFEVIRAAVAACTGPAVPTAWLQASICRRELLVEIEATAQREWGQVSH